MQFKVNNSKINKLLNSNMSVKRNQIRNLIKVACNKLFLKISFHELVT